MPLSRSAMKVESSKDRSSTGQQNSAYELIQRRRLQLLIHSCIYYEYNESIVSDECWKNWALELEKLQKEFPEESSRAPWHESFKDFDHSTGYNLPTSDPWVMGTARWILRLSDQYKSN